MENEFKINKAKNEGKTICPSCNTWGLVSYSKVDICDNCDFEEGY